MRFSDRRMRVDRVVALADGFQAGHGPPLEQFPHDDATGDDGQIRGQAAFAAKMSQRGEVVLNDGQKHFAGQVVGVRGGRQHGTRLRSVMNHVDDEPQEAIDEIFPRAWLAVQATLQKLAVDIRESHGRLPLRSIRFAGSVREQGPP